MIEIPLMHGTLWINPDDVVTIESSAEGSFICMRNNGGWNSPLAPAELASKIKIYKATTRINR